MVEATPIEHLWAQNKKPVSPLQMMPLCIRQYLKLELERGYKTQKEIFECGQRLENSGPAGGYFVFRLHDLE